MKWKIKTILSCGLLFTLFGCSSVSNTSLKEAIKIGDDYATVCERGNISAYIKDRNCLPLGYWGNYPDSGIAEIGNRAGDPSKAKLPSLTGFDNVRYALGFNFENSFKNFAMANNMYRLGYVLSITTNSETLVMDQTFNVDNWSYLLSPSSNGIYVQSFADVNNEIHPVFSYDPSYNTLLLAFNMKQGYKLDYFRLYYSDIPDKLTNAFIGPMDAPITDTFKATFKGSDCSAKEYLTDMGSSPVFNLDSQIGTIYSKDYLLNSLVYRDENDGETIHVSKIEDPDNYFLKGKNSPIGTKFVVKILASDKTGNTSIATFNFTIVDTRGPNVFLKNHTNSLSASYASDFNSDDFIKNNFVITDNSKQIVSSKIESVDGNPIDIKQVGQIEARLKATDVNNNETLFLFTLDLFDDVLPIITSKANEISLSPTESMTKDSLLAFFSASDAIDGDLEVKLVSDTYSSHCKEIGNYEFKVSATDSSGNKAEKAIKILVSDTKGPIFFAKESFLTVVKGEVPSLTQITESLIRQEVIPDKQYSDFYITEGEELTNNLEVGLHNMKLALVDENDEVMEVGLTMKVIEKDDAKLTQTEGEKKSWWDNFLAWLISIWEAIVSFFTGGK